MSRSGRNFLVTINNYTQDELDFFIAPTAGTKETIRFAIGQRERGVLGGVPHLQLYVQFYRKITCRQANQQLGGRAHCELRRGSHEEAVAYCTKEETRESDPFSFGDPSTGQGHRTDWDGLHQQVRNGARLGEIAEDHFRLFVSHSTGILKAINLASIPRSVFHSLDIYYGITGSGKSHTARAEHPDAYWFPGGHGGWFDLYQGEPTIIFDDFDPKAISYRFLLRIADKYPLMLPVKGAFAQCQFTRVVITHNAHPREWYPTEQLSPLLRRATLREFTEPYSPD